MGAVYTTKRSSSEIRSQATSYTTDLGSRPKFGQQLWLETHRRGLPQAKTVVFLGDGAPWLWEMARDLFPQAIQILDWYHATSYLWAVAHELYPKDEQSLHHWLNPSFAALAQSNTALVLTQLHLLAASSPAARTAITYFNNNLTRMDYARYRKLNLQIGSGTIEKRSENSLTQVLGSSPTSVFDTSYAPLSLLKASKAFFERDS